MLSVSRKSILQSNSLVSIMHMRPLSARSQLCEDTFTLPVRERPRALLWEKEQTDTLQVHTSWFLMCLSNLKKRPGLERRLLLFTVFE